MLYFSLDTETTGIDFNRNQIIEFGAIFEDPDLQLSFNEIPKFKRIIRHKEYIGSAVALEMNARIFKILSTYEKMSPGTEKDIYKELHGIINPDELMTEFKEFVTQCYTYYGSKIPERGINVIGKNFSGFDNRFIEHLNKPGSTDFLKINHVIADPATLYVNWYSDIVFPGLPVCKERAGLDSFVSHDALEDAWDVVKIVRKKY